MPRQVYAASGQDIQTNNLKNVPTLVVSLVGNIVGSLLPDIDQASNRLWDLLPGGNVLGGIFKNLFLAHRTISHSLLGVFLLHELLWLVLPKIFNPNFIDAKIVYYSIMIGFVSHLFLDAFTKEGIPLFFPIKWKIGFPPVKQLRIETGKWFEKFVVFPGIIVFLIYFAIQKQEIIVSILRSMVK